MTIEIPPGWEISSLPPGAIVPAHIVEYTLKVDNEKGKVHLARTLNLEILSVEAKYYASLRAFFQTVRKDDEAQIVLQPGPATATK